MAFLSGLWVPLQFMPKFLSDIAPIWPAYHLAQMALDTVGAPELRHASRATSPRSPASRCCSSARDAAPARQRHSDCSAHRRKRTLAIPLRRRLPRRVVGLRRLVIAGVMGGNAQGHGGCNPRQRRRTPLPPRHARSPRGAPPAWRRRRLAVHRRLRQRHRERRPTASAGRRRRRHARRKFARRAAAGRRRRRQQQGRARSDRRRRRRASSTRLPARCSFRRARRCRALMDYSGKKTLTFQARGDGKRYMLMVIFGGPVDAHPAHGTTSRPGPNGTKCGSTRRTRRRGLQARARHRHRHHGPPGPFRFQIDDVRWSKIASGSRRPCASSNCCRTSASRRRIRWSAT